MHRQAGYWALRKLQMIADYQFFAGAGSLLFPIGVDIYTSPKTGKVREVRHGGLHLASLNPNSGLFSLSIEGAKRIICKRSGPVVTIKSSVVSEVSGGRNVFAKHVSDARPELRSGDETIVVSEDHSLVAIGRSLLSGDEAKGFKHGVAIKVRRGVDCRHDEQENGSKGNAPYDGKNGTEA